MSSPPPERSKKSSSAKTGGESSQNKKSQDQAEKKPAEQASPPKMPEPLLSESPALAGNPRAKAFVERLEDDQRRFTLKHHVMLGVLICTVVLTLIILMKIQRSTAGRIARVDTIRVNQSPINQGRFTLSLNIIEPGAVQVFTTSGTVKSEHVERFAVAGEATRQFDIPYKAGQPIIVKVQASHSFEERFTTTDQIDVVVMFDRSGAITLSDQRLVELIKTLCGRMYKAEMKYRVSPVGFGATGNEPQIFAFTDNPDDLERGIMNLQSTEASRAGAPVLRSLEMVARMPFAEGAIRRVYLVTDSPANAGSHSEKAIAGVASLIEKFRIDLRVFSLGQNAAGYAELIGPDGRFTTIDKFDEALEGASVLQ